jgi:DNA (cytosine-5)-methyltransferase 1
MKSKNEKTHLDLFSGIGGFALAARWNGYRTVGFCDNEQYAQAVLKKHWPEVQCHKDIREVRGELYAGVTLLTGGFPCQPFSVAGKQRGKDDNRYLWPEMLRVIQEAKPTWIIGENVAGIVNLALDQVCADLEDQGYEVEPIIIPACAVDAPHRRDRVWIVGHSKLDGLTASKTSGGLLDQSEEQRGKVKEWESSGASCTSSDVADSVSERGCSGNSEREYAEDAGQSSRDSRDNSRGVATWLAEPSICRVANGVPNRSHRLKGLGNAIVPQVASEIIRCINQVMEDKQNETMD